MSRCWSGAPVPVVLERPTSADGPRLDAVGDRDRLHPVADRVELGEAAELVERGEHAGADALGGLMAGPRARAAPAEPAVERPHGASVVAVRLERGRGRAQRAQAVAGEYVGPAQPVGELAGRLVCVRP